MNRRHDGKREVLDGIAAVGPFLGHGLTLAMATAFFFFVGWVIDGRLGTTPILSILGALVGGAGGFYYLVRHLQASTDESASSRGERSADRPGADDGSSRG